MLRDLPIDQLHSRSDTRPLNEAAVPGLAESIADVGLINPIRVRAAGSGWEVIAGMHRLAACKSLGLVEIACDVVESDDTASELAQIDENVFRHELSPAERARYMARRKALYPHLHGNSSTGSNSRFTLHASEVTGVPEPTIIKEVSRGENILSEVLDMVTGTKLDTPGYLDTLKKLPGSEQHAAVTRDLAKERRTERIATTEASQQLGDLMRAWKKASKDVRQQFMEKVR